MYGFPTKILPWLLAFIVATLFLVLLSGVFFQVHKRSVIDDAWKKYYAAKGDPARFEEMIEACSDLYYYGGTYPDGCPAVRSLDGPT